MEKKFQLIYKILCYKCDQVNDKRNARSTVKLLIVLKAVKVYN